MKIKNFLESKPQSLFKKLFAKPAKLMVVSEQEGAEIFIDGESTGRFTPALIHVPFAAQVKLELKLTAHSPYEKTLTVHSPLSYHYCELQREVWTIYQGEASPWQYMPPIYFEEGRRSVH